MQSKLWYKHVYAIRERCLFLWYKESVLLLYTIYLYFRNCLISYIDLHGYTSYEMVTILCT